MVKMGKYKSFLCLGNCLIAGGIVTAIGVSTNAFAVTIKGEGILERAQPALLQQKPVDLSKTRASTLGKEIELFVQLDVPAVSEFVSTEVRSGRIEPSDDDEREHAKVVSLQQDALRDTLEGLGVKILSSMRVGANGFRVKARLGIISDLLLIPGVKTISPMAVHRPSLSKSTPWINVPEVWEKFGSGENVTVAIIDTGIDYLHANFGGSGDPAEYATNDKNIIEPGTFPTAKVVGGYDFAGADYDASDPIYNVPQPDPDPLDGDGHGTHVAGIVAGAGVAGKIGAGVAKGALLYALKVFGDVAISTTLAADAIEWAMDPNGDGSTDDHVDVINLSLGSPFGSPNEPSSIAAQNASELGIIVVAAAGNEGNVPYVLGSPAIAPGVIAVAASFPGPQITQGFLVTEPVSIAGNYRAAEAKFTPRLADNGAVLGDLILANPLDACDPLANAGDAIGKIVLIQRGACNFDLKGSHAEQVGASAFVVFNNQPDAGPIIMAGNPIVNIPGLMIGTNDGDQIANTLGGGAMVSATMDAGNLIATPEFDDVIAGFSSRGPGHGGSTFKPDLAAPGVGIVSAAVGSGDGQVALSGTSMASPQVAGLAALLRPIFSEQTPAEVKAILQNATVTAAPNPATGEIYPLARQGTGVVRADLAANLTAFTTPAGVSFGRINPDKRAKEMVEIELHNLSDSGRVYTVTHVPNQTFEGVNISGPESVTVAAHGEEEVTFKLEMDASLGPYDSGFYSQTEVDGWFIFNDGNEELRVGYIAVVDPASKLKVHSDDGLLEIKNKGAAVGFAEGFTLAGKHGLFLKDAPNAIKALGYRSNDFFGDNNIVEFAVATERPWESPSAYEFVILIDADEDGISEKILVAVDEGLISGTGVSGNLVTAVFDDTGGSLLFEVDTDLNDGSAILPFFRNDAFGLPLGFLPAGDTDFDYQLYIFDVRSDSVDVQTGTIDLANEIVPEMATFGLFPGTSVGQTTSGGAGDMLWLFQNNQAKSQAKIVEIED